MKQRKVFTIEFHCIASLLENIQLNIGLLKKQNFHNLDNFLIKLNKEGKKYVAEFLRKDDRNNDLEENIYNRNKLIHFLADSFLLNKKKSFIDENDLTSDGLYFRFCKRESFFKKKKMLEIRMKNFLESPSYQKTFINVIKYDKVNRNFIIDYDHAPNLYLFDTVDDFKKNLLLIKAQDNFVELIMPFVTALDTLNKVRDNCNLTNLPQDRKDAYRFLYNISEAFLSTELREVREEYGFYLLRWLKARLYFSKYSDAEQKKSLEAYISLIINPDEKWVWKFIDVEKEIEEMLQVSDWKKKILVELLDLKEKVLYWLRSRNNRKLNSVVLS